jgi:hypothetical protein
MRNSPNRLNIYTHCCRGAHPQLIHSHLDIDLDRAEHPKQVCRSIHYPRLVAGCPNLGTSSSSRSRYRGSKIDGYTSSCKEHCCILEVGLWVNTHLIWLQLSIRSTTLLQPVHVGQPYSFTRAKVSCRWRSLGQLPLWFSPLQRPQVI